ncbi:MAG: PspC domain-containing protein, partial [Shewanella sp.]|nr:PspC domain-containing protein [Shewanella sp.]
MRGSNGRTLYRIPQSGKIAGVCAGIAEYFAIETWLVRVLAVSIFLLGGSGVV